MRLSFTLTNKYRSICSHCHTVKLVSSPVVIRTSVHNQKPKVFKPVKMMPVFAGLLSDKDMMNVSRYVASFKPKKKK